MRKKTSSKLVTSIAQGGAIMRGKKASSRSFRIDNPDVTVIRQHLGLAQQKLAELFGISPATPRNWEQGRRKPEGAARELLCVAAIYPKAVLDTVGGQASMTQADTHPDFRVVGFLVFALRYAHHTGPPVAHAQARLSSSSSKLPATSS